MSQSHSVLGSAVYTAVRSPLDGLITLTAIGILPCRNYSAHLEKRPERILPPNWNMVFEIQDICLRGFKPFEVSVQMGDSGHEAIRVNDAAGWHEVPVSTPFVPVMLDQVVSDNADLFRVYARLPFPASGQPHKGCIVVPADSLVTAIHYSAFGPDTRANCENWVTENCGLFAATKGGPEVPWPILER